MKAEPEASAAAPGVYRRAAGNPRQVRDLAFDRLPPGVREKLTHGIVHGAPEPLLAAPWGRAPLVMRALLGVAVTAAAAVPVVAIAGGGSSSIFQPLGYAGVYAALLAVVAVAGGAFVGLRRFLRGVPFRSGRYLFPLNLVEANGGRLRVTALDTLRTAEARAGEVTAIFEDGHEVTFPLPGSGWLRRRATPAREDTAAALARRVNRALGSARALAYPADEAKLALLDPFFEVRVTEDWDAAKDRDDRSQSRYAAGMALAIVAAAPAGYAILSARNALSDELLFEEAQSRDIAGHMDLRKLERYVAQGRRHQDQAAQLLLNQVGDDGAVLRGYADGGGVLGDLADRALFERLKFDPDELVRYVRRGGPHARDADEALFAIARRMDTVASYSTYLDGGGKLHGDEVRKDLLPDADFAQATRSDLVGSLFSFVRRNPGSRHEDEAWQLTRKRYADALPAFERLQKPPREGHVFAEALLAALQDRADPRVTVATVIADPTSVVQADAVLGARYGSRYLPAADRFTADSLEDLAQSTRRAVGSWFAGAFAHGVAEVVRPTSEDEGRPRFEIRVTAVAYDSAEWHVVGAPTGEPAHVTPLVGFLVEVSGTVTSREGKALAVTWKTTVTDSTDGKNRRHEPQRAAAGARRHAGRCVRDPARQPPFHRGGELRRQALRGTRSFPRKDGRFRERFVPFRERTLLSAKGSSVPVKRASFPRQVRPFP